jgi:hypothetical protein
MRRVFLTELIEAEQNKKLFDIILKMVEPERRKRISLDEIIASL